MGLRRTISIAVAGLLAAAVAATVFVGNRDSSGAEKRVVRGVVTAETQALFDDPHVKSLFAKHGLDVQVDGAPDRDIATRVDLSKYDFAVPSAGTAAKLARDRQGTAAVLPFFTPIVCATFTQIAAVLEHAGVARNDAGTWTLDMKRYLALVKDKLRWSDLPQNTSYRSDAPVMIASSSVAQSSAAALYAAIAGSVANNSAALDSPRAVDSVINAVSPLFVRQRSERAWDAPFEDYVGLGIGKTPIAMIYESQFAGRSLAHDSGLRSDMTLMYPAPGMVVRYGLVALRPPGDAVGKVLDDPAFAALAASHGFRGPAATTLPDDAKIAPRLEHVVDTPSFDILESLVTKLDIAEHLATSSDVNGSSNVNGSGTP